MKILFNLIGDLYRTYVPEENVSDYRFAFLVHPRHLKDVYRKFPFFKYFPDSIVNFILSKLWPVTVSRITGLKSLKTGKELRGYVISIPITATQMLDDRNLAVAKILQALRMARNKGAKIVALGALTSSVSHGGLLLKDKVSGVHITTGHAYTGINVTETLQKICEKLDIDIRNRTVAVVGATGSIGSISAEILAKYGVKKFLLIDVDRKKERFESLLNNLHSINPHLEVEITSDMNLLKNVSLVITATNAKGAVIHKEHIKSGTNKSPMYS
jgi:predicted amino acid dehydrogenase